MSRLKKLASIFLTLALVLSVSVTAFADENTVVKAAPTASKVLVNGTPVSFDAYAINGNNYFKIRDLAYSLSGTGKQFSVTWDNTTQAIKLISGEAYTPDGSEMKAGDGQVKSGALSTAKVYKDGTSINLTAYVIGGYTYFKLRDIANTFNFGVTWDATSGIVSVDTKQGYVEEQHKYGTPSSPGSSKLISSDKLANLPYVDCLEQNVFNFTRGMANAYADALDQIIADSMHSKWYKAPVTHSNGFTTGVVTQSSLVDISGDGVPIVISALPDNTISIVGYESGYAVPLALDNPRDIDTWFTDLDGQPYLYIKDKSPIGSSKDVSPCRYQFYVVNNGVIRLAHEFYTLSDDAQTDGYTVCATAVINFANETRRVVVKDGGSDGDIAFAKEFATSRDNLGQGLIGVSDSYGRSIGPEAAYAWILNDSPVYLAKWLRNLK